MVSLEVRDAVHGLIALQPHEWGVVDSPAFQRLRQVQQLAMTHLVYPGARHSRFEHCVGSCHLGGELAHSLNIAAGELVIDVQDVRAAALCHDLGHGPFSHVSEFVFEELSGRAHIHEQISAAIVRNHAPIREALGEGTSEWVADLLAGTGHAAVRTVERDIVAGPADVDKLDYLLRDSHFCGVGYGQYDVNKVIESARHAADNTGSLLAFHRDGIYAVEGLLLARHHMHRQVYGHKTRVATDRMLVRAMLLGVEEGLLPHDLFSPPSEIDGGFVRDYLAWDDQAVIAALVNGPTASLAAELMRALVERKLLRRCAVLTLDDVRPVAGRLAGEVMLPRSLHRDLVNEAEEQIARAVGADPLWVVLHWENQQNPLGVTSPAADDKRVYVVDDDGALESLEEASEIFGQPGATGQQRIYVYVRQARSWDADAEKSVKESALQAVVTMAQAARRRQGGPDETA